MDVGVVWGQVVGSGRFTGQLTRVKPPNITKRHHHITARILTGHGFFISSLNQISFLFLFLFFFSSFPGSPSVLFTAAPIVHFMDGHFVTLRNCIHILLTRVIPAGRSTVYTIRSGPISRQSKPGKSGIAVNLFRHGFVVRSLSSGTSDTTLTLMRNLRLR